MIVLLLVALAQDAFTVPFTEALTEKQISAAASCEAIKDLKAEATRARITLRARGRLGAEQLERRLGAKIDRDKLRLHGRVFLAVALSDKQNADGVEAQLGAVAHVRKAEIKVFGDNYG